MLNHVYFRKMTILNRVRTDTSSESDRTPIWVNQTGSAGVDTPSLTVV